MKHFPTFFKSALGRNLVLILFVMGGFIVLQGQGDQNQWIFNDNDPLLDRPTKESYELSQHMHQDGELDVITDAQGFDNFDIGLSNAEQHMSSNPRNPKWIFFGVNSSSAAAQDAYNTTNGLDWQEVNPAYHPSTCCDPWSAYDSSGVLYYASGVNGQYIYESTNNGNTWTAPVLSVAGVDRNTLAVDQSNGPYGGYLYAAITGSGGTGPFTRSTNGGATWTQTYTSPNSIPGVMIAVGPNGATQGGCVMYVTNTGSSQNVTYTFHRSTNGGANFTQVSSLTVAGYVGTLNSAGRLVINNARTRPYPMIAMDNSYGPYRGRLYLVYASNRPVGNGNKPDIILQYSTNQGTSWSSPITVNDNANPELSDQWFPAIWCEKETGKLYIKWYDTRENPATYQTGVWATYSTDGGQTFAPNQRISNAAWTYPCPACGPNQNCYRGDYDGMTANEKTSYSIWYDPRNCNYRNMGAYFPDFAYQLTPATDSINSVNGVIDLTANIPAVKLYTDTVKFSTTISPNPGAGLTVSYPGGSILPSPTGSRTVRLTANNLTPGAYTITVIAEGPNGTPVHRRTTTVYASTLVNVTGNETNIPVKFDLLQNFPNPFNPTTKIIYTLAKNTSVKLTVYNGAGERVKQYNIGAQNAGIYNVDFDGNGLASGVYYYKLETEFYTATRKMLLIK